MTESRSGHHSICKHTNLPIVWTDTIKSIPVHQSKMPFIVAHEFFDALPIHAFQSVQVQPNQALTTSTMPQRPSLQWRELLVSNAPPPSLFSTPNSPTPLLLGSAYRQSTTPESPPEFQLTLARTPTRHSQYLPESSPRYRRLKPSPASTIEICPDAWLHAADFATRIGGSSKHPKPTPSGAALVIDYGSSSSVPINSLRGIRRHARVGPFEVPGLVDLSADVDFTALADAATRASEGVEVHGPAAQGDFLEAMGIKERAGAIEQKLRSEGRAEDADLLQKACKRLVDRGPGGMGKVYHALAVVPENSGKRRPVGFGGDI